MGKRFNLPLNNFNLAHAISLPNVTIYSANAALQRPIYDGVAFTDSKAWQNELVLLQGHVRSAFLGSSVEIGEFHQIPLNCGMITL